MTDKDKDGLLLTDGVALIARERQRQVDKEGWSLARDRKIHYQFELSQAAACYAYFVPYKSQPTPYWWPWDDKWWKPTPADPVRQLVKAGALIAAEIDRLQGTQAQLDKVKDERCKTCKHNDNERIKKEYPQLLNPDGSVGLICCKLDRCVYDVLSE